MFFILGVVGLNLYAICLILARAFVFRVPLYRPMLWNIFLSVLPLFFLLTGFLMGAIVAQFDVIPASAIWIPVLVIWLLLLPNASYLITELNFSHRSDEDKVPLWYDIILVITLAMSGVVNTVMNVLVVHVMAALIAFGDTFSAVTRKESWIAVGVVLLLLGLGMYLGRYLRVNSWDLKHPISFTKKIVTHFSNWANVRACLGFTFTYAMFIGLIYLIIGGMYIDIMAKVETQILA